MRHKLLRQNIRRIIIETVLLDAEALEKISELLKADNKNAKTSGYVNPQSFEFIRAFGMDPKTFDRHINDIETFQALLRLSIIPIFPDAGRVNIISDAMAKFRGTPPKEGKLAVDFPKTVDKRNHYFYVKFNYENKTMKIVCGIDLHKSHWLAKRDSSGKLVKSSSKEFWPILDDTHRLYPAPLGEVPLSLETIIRCANDFRKLIDQNLPRIDDPNRTVGMPRF